MCSKIYAVKCYLTIKMSNQANKTVMQEKRKIMGDKRQSMGMKNFFTSSIVNVFRPSDGPRTSFSNMKKRHKRDREYINSNFVDNPLTEFRPNYQELFDDDRDPELEPTFSKHRIPLEIACLERYNNSKREYAIQFKREINLLIDNQSTAESAWQLVRTMAYTTLWPPLHTRKELKMFELDFCRLSPAEQRRYDKIMATNFT